MSMIRRFARWVLYKTENHLDPELDADCVSIMRRTTREGLGFNCTFVDDEMMLLVALSQRAVLAGLAKDAQPNTLKKMTAAANRHRVAHEAALGMKLGAAA